MPASTPSPSSADPDVPADQKIGERDLARWSTGPGRTLLRAVAAVVRKLPGGEGAVTWSKANLAFVLFATVALIVVGALTSIAEDVYENVTDHDGVATFDRPVLDWAVAHRSPDLNSAVTTFTDIGGPVGMTLLATAVIAALAITYRQWSPVVIGAVGALGSLAMTIAGKDLVGRARPPQSLAVPPYEVSASFPSGHTLNATTLTTLVVYLVLIQTTRVWQRVLTVTLGVLFVLSMGLSRVFLGHHWLTDVIAGWAIGLAWAIAVITAHRLYLTLRRTEPTVGAA